MQGGSAWGCLPGGVSEQVVSAQGVLPKGDVYPGGVLPRGCLPKGGLSQHAMRQTPPPCGQTDTCEKHNLHKLCLREVTRPYISWGANEKGVVST